MAVFIKRDRFPQEAILPNEGVSLNDCSWKMIHNIAQAGKASSYWKVGDCKAINIDGTVGRISIKGTYYVYILGFDHNGARNTIDFGGFKTDLTNGIDMCFVDDKYQYQPADGTKSFNINHEGALNAGGWKGCDLRYDILGSTDRKGADASVTTAINPIEETLMDALPLELRKVMKPMEIYTDNIGGTDEASNVTVSIDYLPLLSEYEIMGKRTHANSAEQNFQKQYEYYANGGSKVKNKHSEQTVAGTWYTRSPYAKNNTTYFCYIYNNGGLYAGSCSSSRGISPIFRV